MGSVMVNGTDVCGLLFIREVLPEVAALDVVLNICRT